MSVYDPDLICAETAALDYALRRVGSEVLVALDRFPSFNSPHEGWAPPDIAGLLSREVSNPATKRAAE